MRKLPAIALVSLALAGAAPASGTEAGSLQAKVDRARGEAEALGGEIRAAQSRHAAAQREAAAAAARERRLSSLLAEGQAREARLVAAIGTAEGRLRRERRRLQRARRALARTLVGIYRSGRPSTAGVVLGAGDMDELAVRAEYLQRLEGAGTELAERVEQVRDGVRERLESVAAAKARVVAHNRRLAAARAEIAAVRSAAEAASARLSSLAAARAATLRGLKSRIGRWVRQIERAEAASREAAEETVGRWLGGPYSIPTYIVMCESGGNYSALNPSSGAGGAYQIIPSTWAMYGGKGAPHEAPKAEQDRIAAEIWADSGPGAWVCA